MNIRLLAANREAEHFIERGRNCCEKLELIDIFVNNCLLCVVVDQFPNREYNLEIALVNRIRLLIIYGLFGELSQDYLTGFE